MKNKKRIKFLFSFLAVISCCFMLFACHPYVLKADTSANWNTWYTFNENQPLHTEGTLLGSVYNVSASTAFPITFNPTGEYEVSSNTVKMITFGSDYITYSMVFYDRDNYVYSDFEVTVFYAGQWNNNDYRYLFISGVIPIDLAEYLENNGVLALTYVTPPSDLGTLLWSVADIVPNTIQSMTSFEIFGFTLFAIIGTFCLIMLCIKLVKGVIS